MAPHRLTLEQAADFLQMDTSELMSMAVQGEIPCQQQGKRFFFEQDALDAWCSQKIIKHSVTRKKNGDKKKKPSNPRTTVPEEAEEEPIIAQLCSEDLMETDMQAKSMPAVLKELVKIAEKSGYLYDPQDLYNELHAREDPYAVNKEEMVKKIADLVNEKRIVGITNIADISSSEVGIRIIIDVKRGAMGSVILNQLYSMTPLETTLPAQFLVVDKNRPRTLNLKQILEAYLDHREEVITRRTKYELRIAEERDHIVQGLLIAQGPISKRKSPCSTTTATTNPSTPTPTTSTRLKAARI